MIRLEATIAGYDEARRMTGFETKKTARTFDCPCREASDATYLQHEVGDSEPPQLQYLHDTIDRAYLKYKNLNFPAMRYKAPTQAWKQLKDDLVARKPE